MCRHLHAAFVMVAFLSAVPLNAQMAAKDISDSGNRYLEICSSTEKPMAQWNEMDFLNGGLCHGFMMGFRDGVGVSIAMLQHGNPSLASLKDSMEDLGVCIPHGVELGQLTRVTLKYIREHPEQAHLPSAALVLMAELNAFPCTTPAQKQ
jgi:hypothetical protein